MSWVFYEIETTENRSEHIRNNVLTLIAGYILKNIYSIQIGSKGAFRIKIALADAHTLLLTTIYSSHPQYLKNLVYGARKR